MTESPVLYDEVDRLGIITLNRPQKLNALTNEMVQAVADSVAAATRIAQCRGDCAARIERHVDCGL